MLKPLIAPNTSLLKPLKKTFETFLEQNILLLGEQSKLRDACEYALLNGGKRIRPLIVMMVARALGNNLDVLEACLSVEYFHTASIIADDLPCMDNDDYRRSKPALHKMHGETVALLASYALISAGYEKIFHSVQSLSKQKAPFSERANEACAISLDAATRCAGISGAVGGQFKDIFPKDRSLEEILDVIYKKTVTLFEIAFVYGWVFGGGELQKVDEIRKAAFHFGMAFQIWDDIGDMDQDGIHSINIAQACGKEEAKRRLEEEVETFTLKMKKLGMWTPEFQQTVDLLRC
ncbi:MAG: polyprenyl synthetase family protein [Simkaniaceae bacterium]|nr:MAG: polyprenyl synthetase family protein [Simkaniaceae bacterium]